MQSQMTSPEVIEHEKRIAQKLASLPGLGTIIFNDSGWDSRVYSVNNGQYIVKFPRSEKIQGRYAAQIAALKLAATINRGVKIPKVIWEQSENKYFGYEGVPGVALAEVISDLDKASRQTIGTALGNFLKDFHQLSLPGARNMSIEEEVGQLQNWYEKGVDQYKLLFSTEQHQKLHKLVYETWPDELSQLGGDAVLCHGDFHFQNIFYNAGGHIGIIDFGDVCQADRSKDFINLDDPTIFEATLAAYGHDDKALRQKIALRHKMVQVIKLTAQLGKNDTAAVQKTTAGIQAMLV